MSNVSPQGRIHRRSEVARRAPIRSSKVFVVDEELIQVRKGAHPSDAEESGRRTGADPRDQPRKVFALSQSGPTPLSEPLEGAGENDARASHEIAFSQHDVRGEIMSGPRRKQRGSGRAEFIEQPTKRLSLLRVERDISHEKSA